MNHGMAHSDHSAGVGPDGERMIETVIAAHETPLLRYAGRLLNNSSAAQDVVQTAFLKLCDCWEESAAWTADHLLRWLYRTTHNAAIDFIRKEERIKTLHEAHAREAAGDDPPRQFDALELADRHQLALQAMASLGVAEREVLILRLQQGLSYAEIARITGRSEGNVGCILSTAAKQLAQRLRKTGAVVS
jgi:RNA polymerase sigma factor (sigma-70 family)